MFKKALFFALVLFAQLSANQVKEERFSLFADLLYWTAQESGADNWAQVFVVNGSDTTIDILDLSFGWNAGARVGFAYALECPHWDTQLYYTWFHTKGKHQAETAGQISSSFLGNFFINNSDGAHFGPAYHAASLDWTISLNMFDWELGRTCTLNSIVSVRPFVGIKGGWIDQKLHSIWQNPTIATNFTTATENIKNDFQGIGPTIGLDTRWKLCSLTRSALYLFGDISGALLYGHWAFSDFYQNDAAEEVEIVLSDVHGGASMVRLFMGLEWTGCAGPSPFTVRLGYEAQAWPDQLQFYSLNTGRLDNLLTFQGGVLEFCFNF